MGGSISSEQLMLYFNLALTVIVVLGALGGFIKGFKKSLFRFIKDIIFVAGFFFTADLVAGFILNSNVALKEKDVNPINDFLEKDTPSTSIKRYTFDMRM